MAEYSNRDRSKLFKSGLVDTPDIKDASVTLAKLGSDVVSDYALKSYVDTSVSNLIDSAPGVLDTLNELAAAIGDDPDFITTITTSIGTKLNTADFDSTFDTRLGTKTTDNLAEGLANLYYTDARVDTNFATKDTDDLAEGVTNLYYTDARARASISATGSLSYDSETGELSFTLPELTTTIVTEGDNLYYTDARVRAAISGSGGITYDGFTGNFALTNTGVTAATYGSSSLVPVLTIDINGRITSASTVSVAGVTNFSYTASTNTYTISTADGGSYSASGDLSSFTTNDLVEGVNGLYYTDTRFDNRLALKTTDDIDEGVTNLYYTDTRFDGRLALKTTDDLAEGTTNLYYTDARARASVSVTDAGGDGSLAYDSGTGIFTYTGPSAAEVRAHFSGGTGVDITDGVVSIGQPVATTDSVEFADITIGSANLVYNDGYLEYNAGGGAVPIKIGATQLVKVYNATGSALSKGQIVRSAGAQGNLVAVQLAKADAESTSAGSLGMVAQSIAAGGEGYVIVGGIINGLDTSLLSGGAIYLSATTAGAFTQTKPIAPNHLVVLGHVERIHQSQGSIYIKVDNGYELNELHDVYYTTPSNNDLLKWGSANSRWEVGTLSTTEVSEGTNLYWTTARGESMFDTRLATKSTTNLAEGTNLYYTDARARASISVTDAGGEGSLSYDSGTGVITYTGPSALELLTAIKTVDGPTSELDADLLDGQHGSYYLDWTNTTNKPDPVVTVTLTGDVTGTASTTLTDLVSGTVNVTTTISADAVALGIDTTGNYVATITGTPNQINVSGSGTESADVTLSLPQDIDTLASPEFAALKLTPRATAPTYDEGTLWYDSASKTVSIQSASSSFPITVGEREWVRCRNGSGATIPKGTPVYVTGVHISGDPIHGHHPTIAPADASDGTKYGVIGLAGEDIADSSHGYVVVRGWIQGIDTSALTEGSRVHLGFSAPGTIIDNAPSYPNYPMDIGICLTSDATVGAIYVDVVQHSLETLRVAGATRISGSLTVGGDLIVLGTQTIANTNSIAIGSPFSYLNSGDTIGEANTVFTGTGLNDAAFTGYYHGTTTKTYYVAIDGVGTGTGGVDTFKWSYNSDLSSPQATGVDITTTDQVLSAAEHININFNAATGHTLGDTWSGTASPINIDTGWASNRNTGTTGVGYTHLGMFYDVSSEKFRIFDAYDPEPEGTIDIADASYHIATLVANLEGNVLGNVTGNLTGSVSGNASSATTATTATTAGKWTTARTITLGGDLTGNVSIDGSANVTLNATVAANSVALGTDTTGNYMVNVTAGTGISIVHTQAEGSTATITNSAPDQVVSLTQGGATTITGTYPSFTISSTDTTYSAASTTNLGLIKLEDNTVQTTAANTVTTTASRTYGLQVNSSGQGVVNVPWTDTTYSQATSTVLGLVKLGSDTAQTVAANAVTATASRSYAVQVNASGQLLVNVPWVDTNTETESFRTQTVTDTDTGYTWAATGSAVADSANDTLTWVSGSGIDIDVDATNDAIRISNTYSYTLPSATATVLGGIKLEDNTVQTVAANAVTTTASRTYGIQVNSSGQAVVNVPWVDTNTTYGQATSTVLGLVKLGSDTAQTVAANAVTTTASRSYAVQVNASGQLLVNVPWVDTDTNTVTNAFTTITVSDTDSGTWSATGSAVADSTSDTLTIIGTGGVNVDVDATNDRLKFSLLAQDLTLFPTSNFKKSVRVATTANITLSAPQTIDGIAVVAGNRVLVKNQTTASQNGIYIVNAAAWTRSTAADGSTEIDSAVVGVDEGTANGGKFFTNVFKSTDVVGTTSMPWYEILTSQGFSTSNLTSGTLPIARGGTNTTATPTNGGVAYGTGSAYAFSAAGTSGYILKSNGAAAPSWTVNDLTSFPTSNFKKSVKVATTANITLSAPQTIDGIAVVAGDRVLVKNQTTASQNGIYIVAAAAWTRSTAADGSTEIDSAVVGVDQGTVNGGLFFTNVFKSTDVVGTTSMPWYKVTTELDQDSANTASKIVVRDASGNFSAGTITAALSGNATTATTLQTTRAINGTNFNGSAAITTANWGTARTITIGATGKSVNGSANVAWTIAEVLGFTPPKYTESATPPASPNPGDEWWNTTAGALYKRIENSWVQLSPSSGIGIYDVNGTKVN